MKYNFIVPVIIFFTMFIFIIVILILYRNKRKITFKKEINELDIEKNGIVSVQVLSELSKVKELVKTDDLKCKLSLWDNSLKEIKDEKINILTDLITDADYLVDKRDYAGALKKIADIEIMLKSLKQQTDTLLDEMKVITNSEERNRTIITKLKVIYRELENKYDRTMKDYEIVSDSISNEFKRLDDDFRKFESFMDRNDYVAVEELVVNLEESLNKFRKFMDEAPDIILMATVLIPNKIEETRILYFRMQRDGYPLDYLNVEYNIKEIKDKIESIIVNLKVFELGNASVELKTMLDYFNTIFVSFDKEKDAKEEFRENIKKLKKKIENVNRVVYDIYIQIDDIKSTYDLSDADINKFSLINRALEKINGDYKILYEHGKGKTFAYTKLVNELVGLDERLKKLQDDLDYRLKSITSMKDDESRAKEQLNMIENLLLQSKNKIKEYKIPVIPNNYFVELKEASEAIREIIKELDKKPIVIRVLNVRVDTARDLVFKIYNRTNDIVKDVISCEKLIVYGNRYRSINDEVDKAIDEGTNLFLNGSYKQALNVLVKAISLVDRDVTVRFAIDVQK